MSNASLFALIALLAGCATEVTPAQGAPETPAPAPAAASAPVPAADSTGPAATAETPAGSDAPIDPGMAAAPPAPKSAVAWYVDGTTTGTGSANDLGAIGVDANSVTTVELATLMETNKYNGQPRAQTTPADFDEVFLSRATNAAFMSKLGKSVAKVAAAGYAQVIVYSNGPRCISEAAPGGWAGIARPGAMIGLEAYTTTFTADITAAREAHPFKAGGADATATITANPQLFAAFEASLDQYVTDSKTQLGDPTLYDHLSLMQYENMSHDITTLEASGLSTASATELATLWYAASRAVAAKESIHWGIWRPA